MNATIIGKEKSGWAKIVVVLAIAVALLVFVLRIAYTLNFSRPYFFLTSGAEEESWYAIWKFVHGQPVYVDFHKAPFAASYFNWGFYWLYGSLTKLALSLFHLGDEWIPTIGRMITLAGCALGFFLSLKIANHLVRPGRLLLLQAALLLLFFGGYIMGFWAVTVRPDVWALALELAAFLFFLRYEEKRNVGAFLAALALFYFAWSFKQNFAGLLGGCTLYLLAQRRIGAALSLALSFAVLLLLTYFLGSPDYRYLLVSSQLRMAMTVGLGVSNLKLALVKSLPLTLFALFLALLIARTYRPAAIWRALKTHRMLQLLVLCFVVSFLLFFVMAMKDGAADNYFFTPLIALAFLLIWTLPRLQGANAVQPSVLTTAFAVVCLLNIAEGYLILTERFGRVDLRPISARYETARRLMDTLPKPVFFEKDNIANMPWINRSPQTFILSTTYYYKDTYGDRFEHDGVEGLMQSGYFNSIVDEHHPVADLKEKYRLADSVFENNHRFYIWRRNP